jgi:hypothetical protein
MVRMRAAKGVVFPVYGARRRGKRAFWRVIGGKRGRSGGNMRRKHADGS